MSATDRLREEIAFHDRQARERAPRFRSTEDLHVDENGYLDHETWIRPAFDRLGIVHHRDILDLGCGHAMASVVLARHGARVTAMDLSHGYLCEAARRLQANQVSVRLIQADAERLPFADESFDGIWGNAILHHLDLEKAAREILRVLRPGGRAVFCEPWGENPLLNWARRSLPYPGKERTRDEMPLREAQLPTLRTVFPDLEIQGFQLLGMIRRVMPSVQMARRLGKWDERLLRQWPRLWRMCRYVVLTMTRPVRVK